MPRHDPLRAAAAQQPDSDVGPIYAAMLAAEEGRQRRYGRVGDLRRPDHVLQAMRRGEPVKVYVSMIPIPRELREQRGWRMGERVTLFPDM